jgi:Mlc titration factor MtfA (ptsG expression regulator)
VVFGRRRKDRGPDREMVADLVEHWVAPWRRLTQPERHRLVEDTATFIGSRRWEAAQGFEITDDVTVAIAGHAALLTLHLPDGIDSYHDVSSVIVHKSPMRRSGPRSAGNGMMTDRTTTLIGEAHHRGPVLLSWSSVRYQSRHPRTAENVVIHEFAHRLDMLDGVVDGTPPLADQAATDRWIDVCTSVFDRLQHGEEHPVLRSYAATDPGEFFAVACEVFVVAPTLLRDHEPEVYAVLADYFGQDPASAEATASSN